MDEKLFWILLAAGAYFLFKGKPSKPSAKGGGTSGLSGLGVGGRPRAGRPKTEAERAATHAERFGGKLPPRGTGLKREGLF